MPELIPVLPGGQTEENPMHRAWMSSVPLWLKPFWLKPLGSRPFQLKPHFVDLRCVARGSLIVKAAQLLLTPAFTRDLSNRVQLDHLDRQPVTIVATGGSPRFWFQKNYFGRPVNQENGSIWLVHNCSTCLDHMDGVAATVPKAPMGLKMEFIATGVVGSLKKHMANMGPRDPWNWHICYLPTLR